VSGENSEDGDNRDREERDPARAGEEGPPEVVAALGEPLAEDGNDRARDGALGEELPERVRDHERDEERVRLAAREEARDHRVANVAEDAREERPRADDARAPDDLGALLAACFLGLVAHRRGSSPRSSFVVPGRHSSHWQSARRYLYE